MSYKDLITAAAAHLEKYPGYTAAPGLLNMFPSGARWMSDRLGQINGKTNQSFNPKTNYNLYGSIKYGISLAGFISSAWWFSKHSILLTPLSILVFYLLEIQFVFLFPLLIDNSSHPILTGIRAVSKLGIYRCIVTVIPISFFMLIGLFRKKNVFRNWYIGCLAILIWYNNEVRARI